MKNIFTFLFVLLFFSCKKENRNDCIKSSGEIRSETRVLENFDTVMVKNNINLIITQDSNLTEVQVEAGKNLLPLIKTVVSNNTLFIYNDNRCNFMRSYQVPINVYIKKPFITALQSDGSGTIRSSNTLKGPLLDLTIKNAGDIDLDVDVKEIFSHMHGSGDLILKGNCGVHQFHSIGNSYIRCADLKTGFTFAWTDLTGQSYINASKEIGVTIRGSGNIYFTGNPSVSERTISGSGQLIKLD